MNKLAIVVVVFLVLTIPAISNSEPTRKALGEDFLSAEGSENGPIIEWSESNETVVIAWDGIYDGQTEDVWNHIAWVNDTDGVSSVIFRYRWIGETEWMNRTTVRISGDSMNGEYQGNLTYAVWWNYTAGYPETEGSGGNFYFKIWANDTLGYWSETSAMQYMGGYMIVNPPPGYIPWTDELVLALAGGGILVLVILILVLFKRRT